MSTSYSFVADDHGYEQQPPWWESYGQQTYHLQHIVRAVRWTFRDQIKRWGDAEGFPIERGLALDPLKIEFTDWGETLFEWGGRLLWAEELAD